METQNKLILLGYRNKAVKLYTPKRNKVKLWAVGVGAVVCLVTPATNWILLVGGKLLNKFPLWLYK